MRSIFAPIASLVILLCFTLPSHGWWLFHHFHHPHVHHHGGYAGAYAAPYAAPLTLGFQLPGGFGVTTQFDLQRWYQMRHGQQGEDQHQQQPPKTPASITISSEVKEKVNAIDKSLGDKETGMVGNLNNLMAKINKSIEKKPALKKYLPESLQKDGAFQIIERPKVQTSGSGVSATTETKGITKTEKGPFDE